MDSSFGRPRGRAADGGLLRRGWYVSGEELYKEDGFVENREKSTTLCTAHVLSAKLEQPPETGVTSTGHG